MAQICTPRHVPTPRHLNFGNCAPSPLPGSHEQKFLEFFPRMFRRNAATLMNRLMVRSLVLVFAVIGRSVPRYNVVFFGSVHPSGILEARKKPHVIRAAQNSWSEGIKNGPISLKRPVSIQVSSRVLQSTAVNQTSPLFRLVGLGCRKIDGPDIVRHGFCRTLRLITSKIFPYRPKYSREPMVF